MAVNEATTWRLALAKQIAAAYVASPKVQAVVVNGSVGRGIADRYSDIELAIFWSEPPTEAERRAAIAAAGGSEVTLWPFYEPDEEYSSSFQIGAVKIDLGEFTVETVERFLDDVVERYDTADYKQILIAAIQYGTPIHGAALVKQWQARAARYPAGLAEAMIRAHLDFDLSTAEMLAQRDDVLMLYAIICRTERQILGALLGLNRLYLANPQHKWMDQLIGEMRIAPPALAFRLKQIFRTDARLAVLALQQLIEETLTLIEQQLPAIDVAPYRAQARRRRAALDQPPAGAMESVAAV